MAQSLATLRNNIITSIHGRRLGLDRDEAIVGSVGVKMPITNINTGDTGTDVTAFGIHNVTSTGSSQTAQYNLAAPIPGVAKTLLLGSTSTGTAQFLSTANGAQIIASSDGTTTEVVSLLRPGAAVVLMGVTSTHWAVIGQPGAQSSATLLVGFTTST